MRFDAFVGIRVTVTRALSPDASAHNKMKHEVKGYTIHKWLTLVLRQTPAPERGSPIHLLQGGGAPDTCSRAGEPQTPAPGRGSPRHLLPSGGAPDTYSRAGEPQTPALERGSPKHLLQSGMMKNSIQSRTHAHRLRYFGCPYNKRITH